MISNTYCKLLLIIATLLFVQIVGVSSSRDIYSLGPSSLLEENPDYEGAITSGAIEDDSESDRHEISDSSSDDEDDGWSEGDYDDNEYDSDDDWNKDAKSMVNRFLTQTNTTSTKALNLVRRNRTGITVACAIFAFRREIWSTLQLALTHVNKDGKRCLKFRMSPTAVLKILLFVDVMRKIQQEQQQQISPVSGGTIIPLPLRMGLIGALLSNIVQPINSAFLPPVEQHYTFERLNDRYGKDYNALRKAIAIDNNGRENSPSVLSLLSGKRIKNAECKKLAGGASNSTVIVMDMKGLDTGVSTMGTIRDQISFLLGYHDLKQEEQNIKMSLENATSIPPSYNESIATKANGEVPSELLKSQMEIIILLESPGGSAIDYGLASQQIARLRNEPGIKVTICVDKVAASGGYMMACMSSPGCLYAAPFAMLGSIGVIGQTLNIHKSLTNYGIQPFVFRGGKDKAPLGLVGEVTKEGLAKVQEMIDTTHQAFKNQVANARPIIKHSIDQIATGDVWLGTDALNVGLVDRLVTSDEYIREKMLEGEKVLRLIKFQKARFGFGAPRQGFGVFTPPSSNAVRSINDTLSEFGMLLKKLNGLLEDKMPSNMHFSKVASTYTNVGDIQMKMKRY